MTKRTNNTSARTTSASKGRITKVNGEAASVAPEGNEIEQPTEVAEDDADTGQVEATEQPVVASEPEVTQPEMVEAEGNSESPPADAPEPEMAADAPTEDAATETTAVAIVDPFADLPIVKIEDYEFKDLSGVELVSAPRKYEGVHNAAVAAKAPVKAGWKHAASMITVGTHQREFKPTSVYGTIDSVVRSYGRAGVPAYVLVSKVRQAQIGNKRSHFCTALPPIGWAEGWIDTYISKNHGKVMAKAAPVISVAVATELVSEEQEALKEAQAA